VALVTACVPLQDEEELGRVSSQAAEVAPACTPEQKSALLAQLLSPATPQNPEVVVSCSVNLPAGRIVTKRIIIEGGASSGLTLDCNGSTIDSRTPDHLVLAQENRSTYDMITILSTGAGAPDNGSWSQITDVTVKNCNVVGSIYVRTELKKVNIRESSHRAGHTLRMQNVAPKRITFDHITVTALERSPLYFGVGVTDSKLIDSELKGNAKSVAIYLDAESARNLIKGNYIHTVNPREQLAIDASSYNMIIDNWFSAINTGGIYLYRNCGEDAIVRHNTPSNNTIVNNVFYYDKYDGGNPAVFLGSRNGGQGFCDNDESFPFGSGSSDLDYARYNTVMQNQIYKLSVEGQIREGESTDSPNYVKYNTTVTRAASRLAGCHVPTGFFKDFIGHGEFVEVFRRQSNGAPYSTGTRHTCADGALASRTTTVVVTKVPLGCQISGSNAGCETVARCPSGLRPIAGVAACNLESGTIAASVVEALPTNLMRVIRASDNVPDGQCHVGSNRLVVGDRNITGITDLSGIYSGCSEHDANGGDCHILGNLYCYAPGAP